MSKLPNPGDAPSLLVAVVREAAGSEPVVSMSPPTMTEPERMELKEMRLGLVL